MTSLPPLLSYLHELLLNKCRRFLVESGVTFISTVSAVENITYIHQTKTVRNYGILGMSLLKTICWHSKDDMFAMTQRRVIGTMARIAGRPFGPKIDN